LDGRLFQPEIPEFNRNILEGLSLHPVIVGEAGQQGPPSRFVLEYIQCWSTVIMLFQGGTLAQAG